MPFAWQANVRAKKTQADNACRARLLGVSDFAGNARALWPRPGLTEQIRMLDSKRFIAIGFALCLVAALAYVFVFADAQFVDEPVEIDGYVQQPAAQ